MRRSSAFFLIARCIKATLDGDEFDLDAVDWPRVVQLASEQFATPFLHWALGRQRAFVSLEGALVDHFVAVSDLNRYRNEGILRHLGLLASELHRAGVEPIAIKGVGNLVNGLYPDSSTRMIGDIDLLVDDERAEDIWRNLIGQGYRPVTNSQTVHFHCPAVGKPGREAPVEIHQRTGFSRILSRRDIERDARPLLVGEARIRVPSPTHAAVVALAHGYVRDRCGVLARIPFRDLSDVDLLIRRFGDEIDWNFAQSAFQRGGHLRAFEQAAVVLNRLFGHRILPSAERGLRADLYWQRCLINVEEPRIAVAHSYGERALRSLALASMPTAIGRRERQKFFRRHEFARQLGLLSKSLRDAHPFANHHE